MWNLTMIDNVTVISRTPTTMYYTMSHFDHFILHPFNFDARRELNIDLTSMADVNVHPCDSQSYVFASISVNIVYNL